MTEIKKTILILISSQTLLNLIGPWKEIYLKMLDSVQTIKGLFDNDQYKFTVKYFEKEEVREFIIKYSIIL